MQAHKSRPGRFSLREPALLGQQKRRLFQGYTNAPPRLRPPRHFKSLSRPANTLRNAKSIRRNIRKTESKREAPVALLHLPRSPSILHRPLVDDIDIPTPLDDSYEDNNEDQGLPIESQAGSDEAGKPTTCHGTAVKICKTGGVIIPSAEFPLEFRTSQTQAQKICSFAY